MNNNDKRRKIYSVIYRPQEDAKALGIRLSENRLRNGDLITCPIPARAILDDGLSPLHFKALAIISHYYRFGKNGQGCWKSREKLAAHLGCTPGRYSMAVSYLMGNGEGREGMALVDVLDKPHGDGRRKHYGSVYVLDQDAEVLRKARQQAPENRSPSTPPISTQNTGNKSPSHYLSVQSEPQKTSTNQQDETIDNQTEYIRRSQTYLDKSNNSAKQATLERKCWGMHEWDDDPRDPDVKLARLLGNDGWETLGALDEDTLAELRQQLWDGVLTLETLTWARNCAAKAVASG